jgi:hypothetical protein
MNNVPDFNDSTIPDYKGVYQLGKGNSTFNISFQHKPFFIHRWFMRLLLGFKWVDKK